MFVPLCSVQYHEVCKAVWQDVGDAIARIWFLTNNFGYEKIRMYVCAYINWSAICKGHLLETRTPTAWHRLELCQGCLGRLPRWERESERARDEERGKKARLGTAQSNRLLLSAFSVWASGKKTILGYRKIQKFLVFKLRRLLKLLGLFENGGRLKFGQQWYGK